MPETKDKKMMNKIHSACAIITNHLNEKKKCTDIITKCYKTKCKNEGDKISDAMLTSEQINKCVSSSKTPKHAMKCMDDIKKKNNYNNISASYVNCLANNCPDVYEMRQTINDTKIKDMLKKQNAHTHSKTHHNDTEKEQILDNEIYLQTKCNPGVEEKHNECAKAFKTFDEQTKCMSKTLKKQKTCNDKFLSSMIHKALKKPSKSKSSKSRKASTQTKTLKH